MGFLFCDHEWHNDSHTTGWPFNTKKYQHICCKCKEIQRCDNEGEEGHENEDVHTRYFKTCSKCHGESYK